MVRHSLMLAQLLVPVAGLEAALVFVGLFGGKPAAWRVLGLVDVWYVSKTLSWTLSASKWTWECPTARMLLAWIVA